MPEQLHTPSMNTSKTPATEVPDSLAGHTDTALPRPGRDEDICLKEQAPGTYGMPWMRSGIVPYMQGLEAVPRHPLPGYDTGVMSLLLALFLIIAINFRHFSSYFKSVWHNLFSVRVRANVFDDHTVGEERVLISLIILLCFGEGTMAYSALWAMGIAPSDSFLAIGAFSLVALLLYLFQLCAYQVTGFAFAGPGGRTQWIRGFNASQSLLGLALAVPAMLSLFNPNLSWTLSVLGASLYAIARIVFIIKGFRIFFDKTFSLFYFILYLCSLEIIPLLAFGRGVFFLCYLLETS